MEKSHSPSFSPLCRVFKQSSPNNFDHISRSFDENILRRLKTLYPTSGQPSITLPWLSLAADFLSSTHTEAQILISNLRSSSPVTLYLDYSVKLLDICNLILSQIERLRQRRLLISFVLHLLSDGGDVPAPEKLRRARESLSDWDNNPRGSAKERTFQNHDPESLIRDLAVEFERASRTQKSSVDKIVCRTIYAIGLLSVFVAGVAASALYGLPQISKVCVPSEFLWADSFNSLQSAIYKETTEKKPLSLDELADVAARVRDVIDGINKQQLENAVKELETATRRFSQGLDSLYNGVNHLFDDVLFQRNEF